MALAIMGGVMMTGMVTGIFVNAGLSNKEIDEKCSIINDLNKNIDDVHSQCDKLLNGFKDIENSENTLSKNVKTSITGLKQTIDDLKSNHEYVLQRQQYIYSSIVITIIIIIVVKAILSIFFKENI